jgi:hypothetical protein
MSILHETDIYFLIYLAQFFLECEKFQINVVEKIQTYFMFNNFLLWTTEPFMGYVEKHCTADRPHATIKYDACTWHAGYLRVQTHTQNL